MKNKNKNFYLKGEINLKNIYNNLLEKIFISH